MTICLIVLLLLAIGWALYECAFNRGVGFGANDNSRAWKVECESILRKWWEEYYEI